MNEEAITSKGFVRQPDGTYSKPSNSNKGLPPSPLVEQDSGDEAGGSDDGKEGDKVPMLVSIESRRRRLLDDDNPCVKHFVDSLEAAGIIVTDSLAWARIQVRQTKVNHPWEEVTVITITEIPPDDAPNKS
jgi:hypothetical protein